MLSPSISRRPHCFRFLYAVGRFSHRTAARSALVLAAGLAGCGKRPQPGSGTEPKAVGAPTTTFVSIGTGAVTGVYYQVGGALVALINEDSPAHGVRASFQATGGSVYNINAVLEGRLEIGIAQSDRQYQAVHGQAEWSDKGPQRELRSICSLHTEAVTLVATEASGIRSVADLRGKRVNLGNPGSGQRGNALDVLRCAGIDPDSGLHPEALKAADCAKVLQDGRIEAFFYTVGHPAGAIAEATAGRLKVRLVPITGMEALLQESPYYSRAVISPELYPQAANTEPVETIGVMTTVLTSAATPDEVVHVVTRALFENLERLREMHPCFARLTAEEMVGTGLSAPRHPAAERYLREAGLLE